MPIPAPANVRVIVRVRPLSDSEGSLNGTTGRTNVVSLESKSNNTQCNETIGIIGDPDSGGPSAGVKYFTFDAVHGPKSSQIEVFESVKEIVDAVTSGYNGTIVAYGQTGSGKSFTVFGNSLE
jgi:kinesin family protein 5